MKIGIPQGLLYYYYYPLWKIFFEELGHQVVLSDCTTKEVVDVGIKSSVPEICVPIKIYNGHVINLLDKDVDYIYIPRMVSIKKGEHFCPKFMGLPDMIKYSINDASKRLLTADVVSNSDNIAELNYHIKIGEILGNSPGEVKRALKKAENTWKIFREYSKAGYSLLDAIDLSVGTKNLKDVANIRDTGDIKIGLMGYVYDIYDNFVSMNIINKLKSMGVGVTTFEMIDEKTLSVQLKDMKKVLFWTFSNKIFEAGYSFYRQQDYDGIIHVTAFGCGPDSIIGKIMEFESSDYKKPFMTVRVDEHTGENHLQTRVEAFVDMIRRKKFKVERGA